jgi:D-alanyl-lipoteichoic acid acyltransferase DltB (MBOAT superfamily)
LIFSSFQYLLFLPLALLAYWKTRGQARLLVVVVTSYIFYMSWIPLYGLLLLAFTAINWYLARVIESSHGKKKPLLARLALITGMLVNIGSLCYYKYANFFFENVTACLHGLSWLLPQGSLQSQLSNLSPIVLNVILPLGISFFVFEFVHYLCDVFKGDKAIDNFLEFAAFASFFPSQIAGPIKRYQDFLAKLRLPEALTKPLFYEGASLIMQGLFKKAAIADPIGAIVARPYMSITELSAYDAWLAAFGFTIQVYCDFSGYTDMGRGSALLMGIRLPENFQLPYLSQDLGQFWRRWHMSLGSWLRDYVYIPLGGSRQGRFAQWRNLFLTMLTCGLWHGANWHYVLFGALQGVGLIIQREWDNLTNHLVSKNEAMKPFLKGKLATNLGVALTFLFIMLTYALFRAPDIPTAINVWLCMFNFANSNCTLALPIIKSGILVITSVYFSFWLLLSYLSKHETFIDRLLKEKSTGLFRNEFRLASWVAGSILVVASKPLEAIPFVYFQF